MIILSLVFSRILAECSSTIWLLLSWTTVDAEYIGVLTNEFWRRLSESICLGALLLAISEQENSASANWWVGSRLTALLGLCLLPLLIYTRWVLSKLALLVDVVIGTVLMLDRKPMRCLVCWLILSQSWRETCPLGWLRLNALLSVFGIKSTVRQVVIVEHRNILI